MNNSNNIGEIIQECLKIPKIQELCTLKQGLSYDEKDNIEKNFVRVIGYCITFRSFDGIEDYMKITNKKEQIAFLKAKVISILESSQETTKPSKIFEFIGNNLKENGFVFHAANSLSANEKLKNGMKEVIDLDKQNELLRISSIYEKYSSFTDPLGYGAKDIKERKSGWFYDGVPKYSLYYANSPEWFGEFCGNNSAYFDLIPPEYRDGYANRDYKRSKIAITTLMNKLKMTEEDRTEVYSFFNKCWNMYKDTTPMLILIPTKEVGRSITVTKQRELYNNSVTKLLEDVIECYAFDQVPAYYERYYKKNQHTYTSVSPDKLYSVDLTELLPRSQISLELKDKMTISECIDLSKGFSVTDFIEAMNFVMSLDDKVLLK